MLLGPSQSSLCTPIHVAARPNIIFNLENLGGLTKQGSRARESKTSMLEMGIKYRRTNDMHKSSSNSLNGSVCIYRIEAVMVQIYKRG